MISCHPGVEFPSVPETNGVPIVADMSSNFLSRPVDVTKFACIYGGAQKNIGPAGVTVVIVRKYGTRLLVVSGNGLPFSTCASFSCHSGANYSFHRDLLGNAQPITPTMFDYKIQAENESLFNTPPTFGIYMCGLVFKWIKENGGLEGMAKLSQLKSELLYSIMDKSNGYYKYVVNGLADCLAHRPS